MFDDIADIRAEAQSKVSAFAEALAPLFAQQPAQIDPCIAKAEAAVRKAKERRQKAELRASQAMNRLSSAEEAVWRAETKLRELKTKAEAKAKTLGILQIG